MWTSLEKPDGVNGAMEIYSHNMTSTKCDDDGTCYFFIKTVDEVTTIHVYNMYTHPPGFQDVYFFYRGAMVQSWNKFCYQGGMLEVRAQLPGAVTEKSGNPDLKIGNAGKIKNTKFYPTWPGIWMLGNLGRAIFSASTNRMWPFSYNKCDPDVFDPSYQRISACDDNPGYGLNPNQGRGAPEIDVLEGSANLISSSLQVAPGMPDDYRLFPGEYSGCIYGAACQTLGANFMDVPTAYYQKERGHKSWYQGLRYSANNNCAPTADDKQDYTTIAASVKAGITENGSPLFEVTSESVENVPQNAKKTNPQKIMIEEPLYIIFNVALSSTWGATPPNPGKECRGNGTDETVNRICDSFPMYMNVDYIRLYQDLADDLEADNYMQVGCDPASHPTKEWIEGHIDEYEDHDNMWKEVTGKAFCKTNDDCTIGGNIGNTALKTGKCVKRRCECTYRSWGGPRCTTALSGSGSDSYGPPMDISIAIAAVAILASIVSTYMSAVSMAKKSKALLASRTEGKHAGAEPAMSGNTGRQGSSLAAMPKDNYSQNFV
ncbi:hypothetical protein BBO99_00005585 [Phytophthora kernoviae]|uniref:GH16 domain-containing protein n=2 Tax=Phytophthora kernoviae TaxID=325452 RepID=A0A3R7JT85_9STRA|nr:hypothetical protein G195_008469 [Phytophthora kernoviae 00238/432]KAG2519545.1 hypothetical protein JM16_007117 [Phytophthora kernoviae]RLN78993.1 hypothetical protein BBO99_00005585 [Phytophthora kernoviae]